MKPIDENAPIDVRTPAEMALVLEVLGHNPLVGDAEDEGGGVVVWRPALEPRGAEALRFRIEDRAAAGELGPGTSPVLDPADFRGHAEDLVRSVPASPDRLGALYLERVCERLALAVACREQLRRFLAEGQRAIPAEHFHDEPSEPDAFERAAIAEEDARLSALVKEMERARDQAGSIPGPEDLTGAPDSYALPREEAARLPAPPYPPGELEALAGRGWQIVSTSLPDRPEWGMLHHESGALLLVKVEGDREVVRQEIAQGQDALRAWAAYGFRLTFELGVRLLEAMPVGRTIDDAERAASALPVSLQAIANISAGDDRGHRFYVVDQLAPRRRSALLAVVSGRDGEVLGRQVIEGAAAIDQIRRLSGVALAGSEQSQAKRALARLSELQNRLEAQVRPFVKRGADLRALTDSLRPRPGDADKAFIEGAADTARAHIDEAWSARHPPLMGPKPGQREVSVSVCPASMLRKGSHLARDFPQGMLAVAPHLRPHQVWGLVRFHRPGHARGNRFDGLVWLDDHWAWFPKPWQWLKA